ncbi:hypothetical protein GFL38_19645 [Rhizobium leguminosarum bv. viciae]|nr:hypothetical protein [Rhizobium leguminosarum bv. viciae]NKQ74820.1 hypothetical protein [Rhizobium ruizarguesonis]NKQ81855.1 hypothetical protein [Rhizobium ruizarguesonis]
MHLLPQSFDFQTAHSSSQGTSVGTAALLLPVAVRFSESLPHLLPRQAFSYAEPSLLRIECDCYQRRVTPLIWTHRPLESVGGHWKTQEAGEILDPAASLDHQMRFEP